MAFLWQEQTHLDSHHYPAYKGQHVCFLLSIIDQNMHWWHETEVTSSWFIGHSTQKGSQWRIYPSPCSLWEAAMTSLPIKPMTALRICPAPGDNKELIFIIIPPWVVLYSLQLYACLRYMRVKREKRSIFNFSLLQICAFFPSVQCLCSHCEEKASEIFPRS